MTRNTVHERLLRTHEGKGMFPLPRGKNDGFLAWLAGRKGKRMKRKRHSAEQIISKLREAEILLQKGQV